MNLTSNRIISDQADQLRQLMRGEAKGHRRARTGPRLVVVIGGKGGVGTTTIGVNIAVAAAVSGKRTVLVDGHLGRSHVAALCGTRERYTIADVFSGRRTLSETLQAGPAGVRVLAGAWATAQIIDCTPAAQERLLAELNCLQLCDLVVIDAGDGTNPVMRRFCASADEIVVIAGPDPAAIMGAYAALKSLHSALPFIAPSLVMNLASPEQAGEAQARLLNACQRFLAWQPRCLGYLCVAKTIAAACRACSPFVLATPRSPEARQISEWAALLSRVTGESNKPRKLLQVASSR